MPAGERQRVFVDLAPLSADGSNGGAARFVLSLLRALVAREDAHRYCALVKPVAAAAVAPLRGPAFEVEVLGQAISEPRRIRRELRRLPLSVARLIPDAASLKNRGADVLFSPLFTTLFCEPGLPHVVIAYDFQELSHPGFFDTRERSRRRAFRADLLRANRVVAISSATKKDAVERADLEADRATVLPPVVGLARTPLATAEQERLLGSLGLSAGSYAAYPANYWPHKNHERLLGAFARARASRPEMTLVLCGALDAARERLAAAIRNHGLPGAVRALPYLSDDAVTALLSGARFLVFPSLYEGFGIPVLEAMALGTPVACSDLPVLREVAGEDALYFNPEDEISIADALELLWRGGHTREALAKGGRSRAARYAAIDVAGAYHRLLTF